MSERSHLDPTTRRFRRWVDDVLVEDRPFSPKENADADATSRTAQRESRYATLLHRAEAAQQDNRASRGTLSDISGSTSFTNVQRDNAIRFLAGRVDALTAQNNALMQLVLRLAGRVSAMDAPD